MKHIVVIRTTDLKSFPPGLSLISCLLDLGFKVTLLANDVESLPIDIKENQNLSRFALGPRDTKLQRAEQLCVLHHRIAKFLKSNKNDIDAVWTTTDVSARAAGHTLDDFVHIMQISELVEHVPALLQRDWPLHSLTTVELARNAACVVVPEYNRAHIQQTWWNLGETPIVLPNKPYPDPQIIGMDDGPASAMILEEKRKIVLYQGVFDFDRDLEPYAAAIETMRDEFCLYLMGRADYKKEREIVNNLCNNYSAVKYLGFIQAPNHLAYTPYGYIGLLPYVAKKDKSRWSSLNALFCAPNKIWEYSRFGLPMIGSDVPGLKGLFDSKGIGLTVRRDKVEIAQAIRDMDTNYASYSSASRKFFNTIDYKAIVDSILKKVL